jgi:acyl-coenzyme A thioesterase PaaI-like protein
MVSARSNEPHGDTSKVPTMTEAVDEAVITEDHYLAKLAIELDLDTDSGVSTASAPVRSELFAPGTNRIRTGLLATMVDMAAGHVPAGPVGPTIDLRVHVFADPPTSGRVYLTCRPLRAGARLIVSETLLRATPTGEPFGRALTTFMNVRLGPGIRRGPRPLVAMDEPSFDEFLACRVADGRSLELDPETKFANGMQGTIQGGVQALFAELACEHALGQGRRLAATDLDIRYLSRLRVGPMVATVEDPGTPGNRLHASVTLSDGGAGGKTVGFVNLSLAFAD